MTTRTARLRELLTRPTLTVLMEAHSGLSAKLAEEAGFEALWGSGLAISAALGVRDCNEVSWTQVLDVLEYMSDASSLPILLDGDTGYGNFNNVRRLVRKLEQRRVAGVCLEDKLFPKTNSFVHGERQMLAEVDEFCGKLRAAKDTQSDPDFVLVARTEALIAGWGLDEALLRACAYAESGADAILIHSAQRTGDEILAFAKRWTQRVPLVIVPTKYASEPLPRFVEAGITNVIFANHSLRTVITALQHTLRTLRTTFDLMSVEREIATVDEIFRLQDQQELEQSEARYLPTRDPLRAVVLGASQGDFGALVADRPKMMLPLHGRPLLAWQVEALRRNGVTEIGVVRGHRKEAVNLPKLRYIDNDRYAETGELYSLYMARELIEGHLLISYGDVIVDDFILHNLLAETAPCSIAVDASWRRRNRADARPDLVLTRGACNPLDKSGCTLLRIGCDLPREQVSGEWVGLLHLRAEGTARVRRLLDDLSERDPALLRRGSVVDLLNRLVDGGEQVTVTHTYGHWHDFDDPSELAGAQASHAVFSGERLGNEASRG